MSKSKPKRSVWVVESRVSVGKYEPLLARMTKEDAFRCISQTDIVKGYYRVVRYDATKREAGR